MSDVGRIPLSNAPQVPDAPPVNEIKSPSRGSEVQVEVPYTDYESAHPRPYIADYFQLGDVWDRAFPEEVDIIDSYLNDKIEKGDIANSVSAVQKTINDMEKLNNLKHEERATVKIEVLAHYVEFMMKNSKTRSRYGAR